jgi:hypothetical protein
MPNRTKVPSGITYSKLMRRHSIPSDVIIDLSKNGTQIDVLNNRTLRFYHSKVGTLRHG